MLPIRDHNPSGRRAYVTLALIVANVAVFLVTLPLADTPMALARLYYDYAILPDIITHGDKWYTLVTSMFLHGGWMHLGGNILFLWIFGDNMEDELGHWGFLAFYLLAGVAAGLAHVIADPISQIPTIGASGAIAGVMGAYLLFFPKARIDILLILIVYFKVFSVPAWIMLGIWLGLQFLGGLTASADTGGVAYWAHAGGFLAGMVIAVPIWWRRGGTRYWRSTHGLPPHPAQSWDIPKVRRMR